MYCPDKHHRHEHAPGYERQKHVNIIALAWAPPVSERLHEKHIAKGRPFFFILTVPNKSTKLAKGPAFSVLILVDDSSSSNLLIYLLVTPSVKGVIKN